MIFHSKLLNVIKPKFVQRAIHKVKVSEALDRLDTEKIALLFKEDDPCELRDNIVECVLENAKDEMVELVLFKIFDKYVIGIAMDFFYTLKISDFDKDKTLDQAREDTIALVQDRIWDRFCGEINDKVVEKLERFDGKEFDDKVDEILEIVEKKKKV